jgi:hypothetical protein
VFLLFVEQDIDNGIRFSQCEACGNVVAPVVPGGGAPASLADVTLGVMHAAAAS